MPALINVTNGTVSDAVTQLDQYRNLFLGGMIYDVVNGYGADPTGATDSTAAINNAISAAGTSNSNRGGQVFFPPGIYSITSPLQMNWDNVWLVGCGKGDADTAKGTMILAGTGFAGVAMINVRQSGTPTRPLNGIAVRHMSINGNARLGSNVIGIFWQAYNGLMFDLEVCWTSGDGIICQNLASPAWNTYNTSISHCIVHDCGGNGLNMAGTDVWVDRVTIWSDNGATGLDGVLVVTAGVHLLGMHIYGIVGNGIRMSGSSIIDISDGYVENNNKHGIFFDNTTAGNSPNRVNNSYVWANGRLTNNTYDNICVGGQASHGNTVVIANNVIQAGSNTNKPRYGVNLADNQAQGCLVVGNSITDTYQTAPVNAAGHTGGAGAGWATCAVRGNLNVNPAGIQGSASAAAAATGATYYNPYNFDCTVYIKAGTSAITNVELTNFAQTFTATGMNIAISSWGTVKVGAGQAIRLTYAAGAPVWTWMAD